MNTTTKYFGFTPSLLLYVYKFSAQRITLLTIPYLLIELRQTDNTVRTGV